MTARPDRVRSLFLEGLALGDDARAEFLERIAGDAPTLAADVRDLLLHDSAAAEEHFLEAALEPSLADGSQVGRYVVRALIGEGGMGEVYLVEEGGPLCRRLALKLIRLGMDSRAVLARFETERQTLARMDHPCIARVFDAGRTARGQPYFVMEYVDGPILTDHCERQRVSATERIELFLRVCDAVQHAHQRGVIHRDLKPSNILVAVDEERATPKVIDFGLARAAEPAADGPTLTEAGQLLGTPEYMSPEQLDGKPVDVDTRSDIYALGAILYELLTGACPLDALRAGGRSRMRARIREELPQRPSARPGAKHLRGDLDAVVLKALEKDPADRYQTVGALADDLRSYARGEPVRARPPHPLYVARKFVARHRGKFVAASVLLLAAGACLVAMAVSIVDARNARRAERRTADSFDLLATGVEIRRALADEQHLYPAWPSLAPRLREWLRELGEPLVAELPVVCAALAEVRKRALPYTDEMRARDAARFAPKREQLEQLRRARQRLLSEPCQPEKIRDLDSRIDYLEQTVRMPGLFKFETEREHVLHDALASMQGDLEPFTGPTGIVARVRDRLAWAQAVQRVTIEAPREAWRAATAAIASDRRFAEPLLPQLGLVPLGADPHTGLQEFWHVRSGERPQRDASGQLAATARTGVVFVLVHGGTFAMGAQSECAERAGYDPEAQPCESPVHEVHLVAFFVSKARVTRAQWARLGGSDADSAESVTHVGWSEAGARLRQHVLALPTEAQWEYARRNSGGFGLAGMDDDSAEWCRDGYGSYRIIPRRGDGFRGRALRTAQVTRRGVDRPSARRAEVAAAKHGKIGVRVVRRLFR